MQNDEKQAKYGVEIVESTVFENDDTPGVVDMKLLNDTPGCVGIKTEKSNACENAEKAETVRVFEDSEKEGVRKEIQKKFKKISKKVLRFFEF